jgi:hypothetical protein
MPPLGFEPTISAGEHPQTCVLDRAATGTGWVTRSVQIKAEPSSIILYNLAYIKACVRNNLLQLSGIARHLFLITFNNLFKLLKTVWSTLEIADCYSYPKNVIEGGHWMVTPSYWRNSCAFTVSLKFRTNGDRICHQYFYVFNLFKEKMGAIILSHWQHTILQL